MIVSDGSGNGELPIRLVGEFRDTREARAADVSVRGLKCALKVDVGQISTESVRFGHGIMLG